MKSLKGHWKLHTVWWPSRIPHQTLPGHTRPKKALTDCTRSTFLVFSVILPMYALNTTIYLTSYKLFIIYRAFQNIVHKWIAILLRFELAKRCMNSFNVSHILYPLNKMSVRWYTGDDNSSSPDSQVLLEILGVNGTQSRTGGHLVDMLQICCGTPFAVVFWKLYDLNEGTVKIRQKRHKHISLYQV